MGTMSSTFNGLLAAAVIAAVLQVTPLLAQAPGEIPVAVPDRPGSEAPVPTGRRPAPDLPDPIVVRPLPEYKIPESVYQPFDRADIGEFTFEREDKRTLVGGKSGGWRIEMRALYDRNDPDYFRTLYPEEQDSE